MKSSHVDFLGVNLFSFYFYKVVIFIAGIMFIASMICQFDFHIVVNFLAAIIFIPPFAVAGYGIVRDFKKPTLSEIKAFAKNGLRNSIKAICFMTLGGILAYLAIYLTITQ